MFLIPFRCYFMDEYGFQSICVVVKPFLSKFLLGRCESSKILSQNLSEAVHLLSTVPHLWYFAVSSKHVGGKPVDEWKTKGHPGHRPSLR